ncbi:hypothetical protein, partial [Archangium violaceum]|uniref:hypothetical protein n=1 Tax=Archangium violaceum TaxID=83451 RepID=UPI001F48175F
MNCSGSEHGGPEVVEQLTWLLLGFEEGLGLRTVRFRVRAEQRRGQSQVEGWVEEGLTQQPLRPPDMG